jgi:hypothetical protein
VIVPSAQSQEAVLLPVDELVNTVVGKAAFMGQLELFE